MLIDNLKLKGLLLSLDGNNIVYESESELGDEQIQFLKNNKQLLMLELMNTALVEIIEDDYFPLHRYKGEHLPKPVCTDIPWIHECLILTDERLAVAAEYSRRYKQEFDRQPLEHRKDGTARFVTNTWLRELIEQTI